MSQLKYNNRRRAKPIPKMEELYAAGVNNPTRPRNDWVEWENQDTILHLSSTKTVKLRVGDQILVSPAGDGKFDIHGYRPRTEH